MKMRRWTFACLLGGLFLFSSLCWAEEGAENVILRDCDYCHDEIALDLSKRGGAHRDEIGCRGCHPGHPLKGREPYADCSECHDPGESDHFTLPDCLSCHNPHHPRDVDFSKAQDAEKVCITCHENPVVVTSGIANPHAAQGCNECHQAHRTLPQCVNCHEPHNRKMVQADCVGCHPAHNPKAVKFNIAVPSSYCASCHESIVKAINTAGAAHKEMGNCNECHKHHPPETGGIPYCSECHGPGEQAHFGLKRCTGCHDPHAPVVVDLLPLKKVRAACVTCHPEPGRQLKEQPSSHTKMDCNKCHQKHAEALECLTCHQGHNPSMTHKDCLGCHAPHAPIPQAIATDVPADQCAACHEAAVASFTGAGGAHKESLETCGGCHEKHGESPDCLSCHEGHSAEMVFADCVKCHNPHEPAVPKLAEGTPAKLCGACHDGLVETFVADGGAHKEEMGCVGCHQNHPPEEAIPACADCHDAGDSAHYALSNCGECHNPHAPLKIDFAAIKDVQRACVTCHNAIVQDLSDNGGRHKTEIACQDCHQQHPKQGEGVKVECAWCHAPDDRAHFAIDNCLTCHNPHHPKDVDLAGKGELKEVCLSCHEGVVQVDEGISNAHAEFACNECHQSHGDAPDCTECHEPHSDSMTVKDCQSCHAPHNPRAMKELAQAPAALCGACHEGPVEAFANGGAHIDVGCGGCHEAHGAIPVCADCHGADERAHFGLDGCASCHNPHAPLVEDLADLDNVRPACVSCHDEQGKQTDKHPSPHAEMGCNECHLKHGEAQECLECHEPHTPSMTYQDCLACHAPHMPTSIDFSKGPDSRQCGGCHTAPVQEINEQGSAHKSKIGCTDCHNTHPGVGCTDCHVSHPERGLAAKISCARCHAPNTRAHFALKNCKTCHSPHKPLDVNLSAVDPVKPACISCHLPIGSDFMSAPSAHNEMDCKECHQAHGEHLECLECHEPHSAGMSYTDCLGCHNPHKPTALSYPEKVTPALCGACHNEQVQQIADKGLAHQSAVGCGSCHPQHKPEENTILSCRTCHPRLKKLHYTADPCTPCHNPHSPREVDFSAREAVKPVCVTCHSA